MRFTRTTFNKLGWSVMLIIALGLAGFSSRYLTLNPDVYIDIQREVYMAHTPAIILHVAASVVALLVGPFQFIPKMRSRKLLNLHRWLGRIYLISVLLGGLSGLYMAWLSFGGVMAHLGFSGLALAWLVSGAMAYRRIRDRDISEHRRWMTRNYAVTFGAVTFRAWLGIFSLVGAQFVAAYAVASWVCWVLNLVVVELLIMRGFVVAERRGAISASKPALALSSNKGSE